MDTNWNPYLGAELPLDKGSFWQTGWDAAARGSALEKTARGRRKPRRTMRPIPINTAASTFRALAFRAD